MTSVMGGWGGLTVFREQGKVVSLMVGSVR